MSRRGHRFRASVEVPEFGTVEVRGLSPDALTGLPFDLPTLEELATPTFSDHEAYVGVIAAGCMHPRLSEEEVRALSPGSRESLAAAILTAHPAMRRLCSEETH